MPAGAGGGYRQPGTSYPASLPDLVAAVPMASQWHCDVVVVDITTFAIVAAVELDDASHLKHRVRRDILMLEEVLRQSRHSAVAGAGFRETGQVCEGFSEAPTRHH